MTFKRLTITVLAVAALTLGALFVAATQLDTEDRASPAQNPGHIATELRVAHRDAAEATIPLFLWYPADDPTAAPALQAQNGLFYGFHAITDAPPAPGPHSVIVLSHGSGGNAPQLGWLARDLAMHGFIVLGVNHPGTTSGDSDPHRTPHIWDRTNDLRAALDWLLANPPAGLTPDEGRIASLGFSLGGHTALALAGVQVSKDAFMAYCAKFAADLDCGWMNAAGVDFSAIDAQRYEADHSDPRIKAVVAVDPALPHAMTAASLSAVDDPILLISLGLLAEVPQAMNVTPILETLPNAVVYETRDSWHFSFLAECSTLGRIIIGLVETENICDDPVARSRADVHRALRPVIGDFLNEALSE